MTDDILDDVQPTGVSAQEAKQKTMEDEIFDLLYGHVYADNDGVAGLSCFVEELLETFDIRPKGASISLPSTNRDPVDLEKFCIAFGFAYGTELEREHYKREPEDGMTAEELWRSAGEKEREFMRKVMRNTFASLALTTSQRDGVVS
jgi:hypothetical protein